MWWESMWFHEILCLFLHQHKTLTKLIISNDEIFLEKYNFQIDNQFISFPLKNTVYRFSEQKQEPTIKYQQASVRIKNMCFKNVYRFFRLWKALSDSTSDNLMADMDRCIFYVTITTVLTNNSLFDFICFILMNIFSSKPYVHDRNRRHIST